MKKNLLFAFILCITYSIAGFGQRTIYISVNTDRQANGSPQHPYHSISDALQFIRTIPGNDSILVKVASGNYFIDEPILINEEDTHSIVFEGDANNKPSINGGMSITGWTVTPEGWWKCHLSQIAKYGMHFEQLYVNGQRAIRARTPDKGWFMLTKVDENVLFPRKGSYADYAIQKLYTNPENLSSLRKSENIEDVTVTFYHKWDITRKSINYLQPDSGSFCISGAAMEPWNPLNFTTRFVLENYKEALSVPGEWFLDKSGDLYYIPRKGETMQNTSCYAPLLKQLLIIKGQPDKCVKNKTFRNISFDYSADLMPVNGNEPQQAASGIGATVQVDWGEHIFFENCEVKHTGNYAFWFRQGCHSDMVRHSFLYDLGAGGIKIGETNLGANSKLITTNVSVVNNIIRHVGFTYPCAVGVIIFNSGNNKVLHNEIADLRYSGISLGWMWGYTTPRANGDSIRSAAVNNEIAYNHIHHIGWGELSDMGAVYSLGVSPGTHIHHNVIHDVYSYDYGGWGLYTDEGSSNIVLDNNLVYACKSGCFHQHYGANNIVRNNIFAFGLLQQLQVTRVEDHRSFSFTNNIILMDSGVLLFGPWDKVQIVMNKNCYWNMRGNQPTFLKASFKEWKKTRDKNSVIADPLFKDPLHADFTFKSLKIARKIGFTPFDYKKAGVEGTASWKEQALMPKQDIETFDQIVLEREKNTTQYYTKHIKQ